MPSSSIVNLAYELCSIPSITGEEYQVLKYLCQHLENCGMTVEKIPVSKQRYNIFAYFEKRLKYNAIFCTHVDCVAPHIPPYLDAEEKILYGRGTADAKGIAACMIEALLEEKALGHQDCAILLTVGEEEASDGAKVCQPVLLDKAHFLVVGEPTELKAAFAQKGSLVFDIEAFGKASHSSMPHLGSSAIHDLFAVVNKLLAISWPYNDIYQETLLNIGVISGGEKRNVLAPYAQVQGIMRTSVATDHILDLIKPLMSPSTKITIHSQIDPFLFYVPEGCETFLAGFGSDAPHLLGVGTPLLIGPGSLTIAHTPDEHISYHALNEGVLAYRSLATKLRAIKHE